eukprot:TRINITY_DN31385_c0_g1_i1.p1 TRINITY_DN31385_c0_g1~~TRINITY_DN31385_c0_g1_i1.p1  ORF type:complete len:147 (+),score=28.38 TRINITY_DN31385_c0_g1_i1:187-627(+)
MATHALVSAPLTLRPGAITSLHSNRHQTRPILLKPLLVSNCRAQKIFTIECSSRPQKKATAHHNKTRPKKHQPYDKNRKGPTKYPPPIFPANPASYLAMALRPKGIIAKAATPSVSSETSPQTEEQLPVSTEESAPVSGEDVANTL